MLTDCNAIGAIVTCGGAGMLLGASIAAWLFGCKASTPSTDPAVRHRAAMTSSLYSALDDLTGVPTPRDIEFARSSVEGVVRLLDTDDR